MLSILIPTYNYNIYALAVEIQQQCTACGIEFEIICLDDASNLFHSENNQINELSHASYSVLQKNIGRSSIRNLLAKKAKYEWLLFLDADVFPKNKNFIKTYLVAIELKTFEVIYGGINYKEIKPEKEFVFRWIYGIQREALNVERRNKNPYLSFLTLNFLIRKSVITKNQFNEKIPNLRHEDTLFSYNLMQNKIAVGHIDNPVYHLGLDHFEKAIEKENESVVALKYLIDHKLLAPDYVRISTVFAKIKKLHLSSICSIFYKSTRTVFLKNLSSNSPSLFIFDLYRIGYLCSLKK